MSALAADHVTRRFGPRVAVNDVSFVVHPGEVLALVGPNGAGKTTTLRMPSGLVAPSSGAVHVAGEPMTPNAAPHVRARIGLLTEAPGLWDGLTVEENLLVYARLYGVAQPSSAVDSALARLGLSDRTHECPGQLSKGLRQRVALARCLLHQPRIVLLDEPTVGLDPESTRDVRDVIGQLREDGCAVLLCSHNLDEVERLADRVTILRTKVLATGSPSELRATLFPSRVVIGLAHPAAPYVEYLARAGADRGHADGSSLVIPLGDTSHAVPQLVRLLVEAGAEIVSVAQDQPSLEEVYVRVLRGATP